VRTGADVSTSTCWRQQSYLIVRNLQKIDEIVRNLFKSMECL